MTGARDKTHAPKSDDAYMTIDERVVPALLQHFLPRGKIWEPAAGQGHIVRALRADDLEVVATDIRRHEGFDRDAEGNFLAYDRPPPGVRTIITNPPNSANLDFARHSLELMRPVGGMVALYQRHEWDATKQTAEIFDSPAYAFKITCRFRPRWFEPEPGKSSSPFHRWSWYCWDWSTISLAPVQRFA